MSRSQVDNQHRSARLFIFLGALWLFLGVAYLFYQASNPTVEVKWETETEIETAGFNLYRSAAPGSEFDRINTELIASQGEALSGATYTYADDHIKAGQTYYYLLEEVEYNLATNRYDDELLAYKVPYVTWWTAVLTAASAFVGLALMVTGFKEDRNV